MEEEIRRDSLRGGSPPPYTESHWTLRTRVKDFSKANIHRPHPATKMSQKLIDYEDRLVIPQPIYLVGVHPNKFGYDRGTEGSVLIEVLKIYDPLSDIELVCMVAVIDCEGNVRFPRSFVAHYAFGQPPPTKEYTSFVYISRNVLLDESSELLPNDILTVDVEIYVKKYDYPAKVRDVVGSPAPFDTTFTYKSSPDGFSMHLPLDSPLAKRLCKESRFFERMSVTPMKEKNSRLMVIPQEEKLDFHNIENILLSGWPVPFKSADGIVHLYNTADKYGIGTVMNACKTWLKLYLDSSSEFDATDEDLKGLIEDLERREENPDVKQIYEHADTESKEWTLESRDFGFIICSYSLKTEYGLKEKETPEDRDSYEFYF